MSGCTNTTTVVLLASTRVVRLPLPVQPPTFLRRQARSTRTLHVSGSYLTRSTCSYSASAVRQARPAASSEHQGEKMHFSKSIGPVRWTRSGRRLCTISRPTDVASQSPPSPRPRTPTKTLHHDTRGRAHHHARVQQATEMMRLEIMCVGLQWHYRYKIRIFNILIIQV
jgi:hypothetical protein